ncbi:head GIN domain-containing protein [Flavicella sp.]|uniref:head GIN domain-containing protein n=1 Tax=Flavicella sp. TaxID=2957742 RepID=UPI00261D6A24|nr:head GIN domain-containing protein [Flavicella sp.]MDG1805396.1 DUF2807 domain-containing protein [Flavicella sp.]
MKKIIVAMFFLVVASATAQDIIEIDLEKFDKLKVYNGLNVNLIKSDQQKIEISGERANEILVKNKKGTLKISLDLLNSFNHQKVVINLFYNSNIAEMEAKQGAVIRSTDIFKQTQLTISAQEGAYIKLDMEVDYLTAKGITGGHFQLKGITETQNVSVVSGSSYEAFYLESNLATMYVSTGSTAQIQVSKALDAKAKLGGTIEFAGRPESVSTAESMGGKIKKAKEDKEIDVAEKQQLKSEEA